MLTITLLGTAATMPLPDRALTTAVTECVGHSLLFDCGEGTQAAARRAGVNLMKLDAICLTHYHGDHIFGLPGLLQTLGCQGRTKPLALYGPAGMAEVWPALRALTGPLPYPIRAEAVDLTLCRQGTQPGGLFDEQPSARHLYPHEIPALYARCVQGLRVRDCRVRSGGPGDWSGRPALLEDCPGAVVELDAE